MKNGVAIVDVLVPYNYMIFGKVFRGKEKYPCCHSIGLITENEAAKFLVHGPESETLPPSRDFCRHVSF